MTGPVRVLVVDDSVVSRRLISLALSGDPAVEVVGVAANGRIALAKVALLRPDLVTLDVEMPDMDGLETLRRLRTSYPDVAVVMVSGQDCAEDRAAHAALDLGVADFVTKPGSSVNAEHAVAALRAALLPRVRSLPAAGAVADLPRQATGPVAGRDRLRRPRTPPAVLALGASTGGPDALATVLSGLPATFPVPVLVVQHMPSRFTGPLAQRLDARCALRVTEARDGEVLRPGTVLLAPGGVHLRVARAGSSPVVVLDHSAPVGSCRPSVDVLLTSVAEVYGERVLAAVLTGMGSDGAAGCEAVVRAGGTVVVQDRQSSVVWGMPGVVAARGLADEVVPLDRLAAVLFQRTRPPTPTMTPAVTP